MRTSKIEKDLLNESPFSQIFGAIKQTVQEQIASTKSGYDPQYAKYQNNPAGFVREVLGETNLTPDQLMAMHSVVENDTTVLQSANGVGKTYIMSRLAVWAYKCFEECQVYTAAAPPEDNLKRLLWGEIGAILDKNKLLFAADKVSTASLEVKRAPLQFITGVTIPQAGDDAAKVARFCVDAEELFELQNGSQIAYGELIGKTAAVKSVTSSLKIDNSIAEFYDNGEEEVFEIVLQNGAKLLRTKNHPLFAGTLCRDHSKSVGNHIRGRVRAFEKGWVPVKNLQKGDVILCPKETSFNFGTREELVDVVKLLAYLIGDGDLSGKTPKFFQENNKQLAEVRKCAENLGCKVNGVGKNYAYSIVGDDDLNHVTKFVKKYGLYGSKAGTKKLGRLKELTKPLLSIFLNRLFSTDGWACICQCGEYEKPEIGYCSNSEILIREIQLLLHRFGIRASVRKKKDAWILTISRSEDVILFSESIGIYGKEKALKSCVQLAKTMAANAAWRTSEREGFIWERITSIKSVGVRKTVCVTVPGNETYLTNVVEHNSGKHSPFLFFFVDEGDAIPKAVYEAIESCLSGGFGRLVISYNPRSKTNPVYQMSQRNEANTIILSAFNHPNVITGQDLIPGAVDRQTTCRRIVKWTRPLRIGEPVTNTFKVPDFLVGVVPTEKDGKTKLPAIEPGRRKIVLPEFAYMVLGLPSSKTNNQLIDRDWCEAAIYRYKKWVKANGIVAPYVGDKLAGLDVAEFGSDFSVFTKRILDFVFPQILWGGTDITQTSRNAESLCLEHDIDEIYVDSNGLGSGVWSNLSSWGINAQRIMVQGSATETAMSDGEILGQFDRVRDQMWWACREWLRTSTTAMIPDGETENQYGLIDQLCAITYDRTKQGKIKMCENDLIKEKLNGKSPDEATSLVLTFAPKPNEEGTGDYNVSNYIED